MTKLHQIFRKMHDPRVNRRRKHKLLDIIILSILAVLCGAESWDSIEMYGKMHIDMLRQILELPNGIPSHDTINRVFSLLNPRQFERLFMEWANTLKNSEILEKVIAVDGKTVRGSKDSFHQTSPIHLVHAWSIANNICLGQLKTADKSNEITAIPELLELLEMENSIITIDAMGTQTAIAEKIIDNGADYILAVKDNQQSLREEVEAVCKNGMPVSDTSETEKGHGRIETRRCEVFAKNLRIDDENRWKGLQSVVKITSTRELAGKTSVEERYYISSLGVSSSFNRYIRNHWGVENSLHWTLDMVFREDEQRKRIRHAAENFAVIRKIALNLLKKDSGKESLRSKRLKAAWNRDFLLHLLKI
jgi:predicted transposase YbfD/YdcC